MRAIIYIDTIEQFDDIRHMADMASVPNYPVHNMKEMRERLYDKPKLVIEGKTAKLAPFVFRVKQMGLIVTAD